MRPCAPLTVSPWRLGLIVRTVRLVRATTKHGGANLVTNLRRLIWLEARPAGV